MAFKMVKQSQTKTNFNSYLATAFCNISVFSFNLGEWKYTLVITVFWKYKNNPAGIYLFKVNKRDTRRRCKVCSKL